MPDGDLLMPDGVLHVPDRVLLVLDGILEKNAINQHVKRNLIGQRPRLQLSPGAQGRIPDWGEAPTIAETLAPPKSLDA